MKQNLRSFLILSLCAVMSLCGMGLKAQSNYVEIAPSNNAMLGSDGRPEFLQMIYTAEEMGNQSRQLYGMVLHRILGPTDVDTTLLFDIYLGQNWVSSFSSTAFWQPSMMTRVFTGPVHIKPNHQWDTIIFDNIFPYNSSTNLVLTIFEHSNTIIQNNPRWYGHTTNQNMCLQYMRYGDDQVDMNHGDNWSDANGTQWDIRYNVRFITSNYGLGSPEAPTVQANYQQTFFGGADQIERQWKTYGIQGCWWEFHGADTRALCHLYPTAGQSWGQSRLVSPIVELDPDGTSLLSFEFKNDNAYNGDSLTVYYSTSDDGDQWFVLKHYGASQGFQQAQIQIPSCSKVRIAIEALFGPGSNPIQVRNLSINQVPAATSTSSDDYYAFINHHNYGSNLNQKFVKFNINDPTSAPTTVSDQFMYEVYSAEKVGDYVYYVSGERDNYGLYRTSFDNDDMEEGEFVAELDYGSYTMVDLRYPGDGDYLYGLELSGSTSRIIEINLNSGATQVASTNYIPAVAMAITPSSETYLISENGQLYKMDSPYSSYSPNLIVADPLPRTEWHFGGSMIYDQSTGKLIWLHYGNNEGEGGIYGINSNDGTWEFYGKLAGTNCNATSLFSVHNLPIADVTSTINFYGIDHTIYPYSSDLVATKLVSFSMQNPSDFNNICDLSIETDETITLAAEMIHDTLFYLTLEVDENPDALSYGTYRLYKQPFNGQTLQGSPIELMESDDDNTIIIGLFYNPSSDDLFTTTVEVDYAEARFFNNLHRINRSTGELEYVTEFDPSMSDGSSVHPAFAYGPDGTLYILTMDAYGYTFLSKLTNTGETPCGYTGVMQEQLNVNGMYVDPNTGELFWTTLSNDENITTIYKLDTETGAASRVGSLATSNNILTCMFLNHSTQKIEEPSDIAISTYPNPATKAINVAAEADITMLQLYSLQGSLMRVEGRNFGINATLDIDGIAAGTYLLNITTSKGNTVQKVVIK